MGSDPDTGKAGQERPDDRCGPDRHAARSHPEAAVGDPGQRPQEEDRVPGPTAGKSVGGGVLGHPNQIRRRAGRLD
jgi:hypothetical protein